MGGGGGVRGGGGWRGRGLQNNRAGLQGHGARALKNHAGEVMAVVFATERGFRAGVLLETAWM